MFQKAALGDHCGRRSPGGVPAGRETYANEICACFSQTFAPPAALVMGNLSRLTFRRQGIVCDRGSLDGDLCASILIRENPTILR